MRKRKDTAPHEDRLIDFCELRDTVPGETLQALTEHICKELSCETSWIARGPDGGRDLLVAETLRGEFVVQTRRWLVQCKHFAESGRAVNERDLGSVKDQCAKHKADGFLLVTTTVATNEVRELFEALTANREHIVGGIWDEHRLRELLLRPQLRDVLKRFLPKSFARVEALEPTAIFMEKFRQQGLPREYVARVEGIIKEGLAVAARRGQLARRKLSSADIYPPATAYRARIEEAAAFFTKGRIRDTAECMDELPFEEWEASVRAFEQYDTTRAQLLLHEMAENAGEEDHRFAAVRQLVEWGGDLLEVLPYLRSLDAESLGIVLRGTDVEYGVSANVEQDVRYGNPDGLGDLPPHMIDDVTVNSIEYRVEGDHLHVDVEFRVGVSYIGVGDGSGNVFPGTAKARIRSFGELSVEKLYVDTSGFAGIRDEQGSRKE